MAIFSNDRGSIIEAQSEFFDNRFLKSLPFMRMFNHKDEKENQKEDKLIEKKREIYFNDRFLTNV